MKMWSVMAVVAVMGVASVASADEKSKLPAPGTTKVAPEPAKAAEPVKAAEPAKAASSGGLTVEAKLCKNLQNREPVDVTDTFKIADGQVITFSRVTGGAGSEIHHVYFLGDKQLDDITLKVNGSPWRTNSKKTLRADAGMTGDWRVEIRDGSGSVLETLKFKVE